MDNDSHGGASMISLLDVSESEKNAESALPEDEIIEIAQRRMGEYTFSRLFQLPSDCILTRKELARMFGCSCRTLRRMVKRFEIPPETELGGRDVWVVGKVKEWIVKSASRREAEAEKEALRLRVFLR